MSANARATLGANELDGLLADRQDPVLRAGARAESESQRAGKQTTDPNGLAGCLAGGVARGSRRTVAKQHSSGMGNTDVPRRGAHPGRAMDIRGQIGATRDHSRRGRRTLTNVGAE